MSTVEGTIATILGNSGAIERCPECGRALVNDHCVVHLDVEPEQDVRVKAELEDGTRVVFGTELVEHLLGLTTEEAHSLPEYDVLNLIQGTFRDKHVSLTVTAINEEDDLYAVNEVQSLDG